MRLLGDAPVDVPAIPIAIDQLLLLTREELPDGGEECGFGGEGETQFVGGAVVEAHCLEDDREDEQL